MRKYSPVIGLLVVITAMATLQFGTLNAHAYSTTVSSQSNQIRTSSMGDQGQMLPIYTRFARDAGDAKNADEDKDDGDGEEEKEDEDKKDEEGGGFDRLWDVVLNG
jgi:hypothetical protein